MLFAFDKICPPYFTQYKQRCIYRSLIHKASMLYRMLFCAHKQQTTLIFVKYGQILLNLIIIIIIIIIIIMLNLVILLHLISDYDILYSSLAKQTFIGILLLLQSVDNIKHSSCQLQNVRGTVQYVLVPCDVKSVGNNVLQEQPQCNVWNVYFGD